MGYENFTVVDCDGHIIETNDEMGEFLTPALRRAIKNPSLPPGVFPSLDGFHLGHDPEPEGASSVRASNHRKGSAHDWLGFLDKAKVERTVMFPTLGLSVGFIQRPDYAVSACRAYNDYMSEKFRKVSDRLHPAALIPMQDPKAAAAELKRAVVELDLAGAMIPSTGLPLHVGHEYYDPIYRMAAELDCPLSFHGGSNFKQGIDTFSNFVGSHVLHHTMPLMHAIVAVIYHGVWDRYPKLRLAFLEGGSGWVPLMLDRMERDEGYFKGLARRPIEYLQSDHILVGCEGSEDAVAYAAKRVGIKPFAYASDYPHEVDLEHGIHEIEEVAERDDLSDADKQAVLGENARRFYKLPSPVAA